MLLLLVIISVVCVVIYFEGVDLFDFLLSWIWDVLLGLGGYGFYKFLEQILGGLVEEYIGQLVLNIRVGMELVLVGSYVVLVLLKLLVFVLLVFLYMVLLNIYFFIGNVFVNLNKGLESVGYVVLDRKESLMGYVLVVDSLKEGYRVMRCDYFLLGGEWVKFLNQGQFKGNQVVEFIYGVFVMFEVVRLVKIFEKIKDYEVKVFVM